jgi:hypothetical protein
MDHNPGCPIDKTQFQGTTTSCVPSSCKRDWKCLLSGSYTVFSPCLRRREEESRLSNAIGQMAEATWIKGSNLCLCFEGCLLEQTSLTEPPALLFSFAHCIQSAQAHSSDICKARVRNVATTAPSNEKGTIIAASLPYPIPGHI